MEKSKNCLRNKQSTGNRQKKKYVIKIPLLPILILLIVMGVFLTQYGKNTFNLTRN